MTTFEARPGDVSPPSTDGAATAVAPGWYADPFALHRLRYHSGTDWTDHVTHFGPTPCQGCNN